MNTIRNDDGICSKIERGESHAPKDALLSIGPSRARG